MWCVLLVQVTGREADLKCFFWPVPHSSSTHLPSASPCCKLLFCVFHSSSASLCVCWGGVFDTRALTKGKSGADMKHIRQGSACDATAEARKYFTAYPLDSWHLRNKMLIIYCKTPNKQWDLHADLTLQNAQWWLYIWRTWSLTLMSPVRVNITWYRKDTEKTLKFRPKYQPKGFLWWFPSPKKLNNASSANLNWVINKVLFSIIVLHKTLLWKFYNSKNRVRMHLYSFLSMP